VGTAALTLFLAGLGGQEGFLAVRNSPGHPLSLPTGCSRAGATRARLLAVRPQSRCALAFLGGEVLAWRFWGRWDSGRGVHLLHADLLLLGAEICFEMGQAVAVPKRYCGEPLRATGRWAEGQVLGEERSRVALASAPFLFL